MESYFSAHFFINNRRKLSQLFTGTAPIVIAANGLLQSGGDSTFNFAQDANFWYLTGIDEPDIVLVMDKDKEYLIVPTRSNVRETFDGALSLQPLKERSGVQTIYDESEGWDKLKSRLKKVKNVATLASPPSYIDNFGFYTNPARSELVARLKGLKSGLSLLDLNPHLTRLRMVKQPEELSAITQAVNITTQAMKEATKHSKLKSYTHEYMIEAELSASIRRRGASGHAFTPIIAGGKRACTMHNTHNNTALKKGELILIDAGAEVEHYAADLCRTYALGPSNKRQKQVHQAVSEALDYALSQLKPGVYLKDYEKLIENFMGEKLRELGLIKSITSENVRRFFPHATSHFVGLNVHDTGDYQRALEPGNVLAVEPGIYITKESVGVRIEENVLITKKGINVLSNKLPRQLDLN